MNFIKNKQEELKKLLLLIFLILVLIALYVVQKSENKIEKNVKVEVAKVADEKVDKSLEEILKQQSIEETQRIEKSKYMPANKDALIKLAKQSAGKSDPFTQNYIVQNIDNKYVGNKQNPIMSFSNKNLLLPPPDSLAGLPELSQSNLTPADVPGEGVILKGFIGDKVILNVNGETKALQSGEKFQNVQILEISSINKTVKIKNDGKNITKRLEITNLSNVISKNI